MAAFVTMHVKYAVSSLLLNTIGKSKFSPTLGFKECAALYLKFIRAFEPAGVVTAQQELQVEFLVVHDSPTGFLRSPDSVRQRAP